MRIPRSVAVLTLSTLVLAAGPGQAYAATLGSILPVTTTVTQPVSTTLGTVTGTLGGVAPDPVGGVVTGAGSTLTGAIDSTLTSVLGSSGSTLPTGTLTDLVGTLLGSPAGGTTSSSTGTSTTGGTIQGTGAAGGGTASSDRTPPSPRFEILSRLGRAVATGRLSVRVTSGEASVVAFNGVMRGGKARRVHGRALPVVRTLQRTKRVILAFRRAGSLTVAVTLPAKARRALRNAATARVTLQSWSSDLARNQARSTIRRTLR